MDLGQEFGATTTGVTSLNSQTGDIDLVAGTNVTITPGSGTLTIDASGGTGTVTSVSVVSANGLAGSVATATTTPAITLSTSVTGILQGNGTAISAATTGDLTDAGTDGISITGGTGAVLGSGTSISQHVADTTHNGYLSSTDWNTFNNKQAALTIGDLSDTGTDGITVTGGTGSIIGAGVTLSQHVADSTHNGYLSSSDWTTFNNKLSSTSTTAKVIFVSQDTGNDANTGTYFSPLKTIQAGINKAELIAAYYNQVIVNVTPSSGGNGYNENLTFSQQGVTLQSYSINNRSDSAVIKGTITVNLTGTSGGGNFVAASNYVYLKGFVITTASGDTITFSGSTFQRLWMDDVYVDNTGTGSALVLTNTGSSGGTKSTVHIKNSDINNNSASSPTMKLSAGRIFASGMSYDVQNSNASGQSLLIDGASATSCYAQFSQAAFTGQVSVSDNLSTLFLSQCTVSSGSAAAIVTPASPNTGFISLGQVGLTTTNTNSITGAGVVALLGEVVKLSTGGDVISTVTQATVNSFPQGAILLGAGATQNTNTLLTVKNGHITSQQSTAPTSALQTGAGTTASRTLTRCTDTAGNISITPNGSGIASGAQLIVTFNKAYATAPVVVLSPANAAAGQTTSGVGAYVTSSTTTFTINFANAGTAATAYAFTYQVIET